MFAIKRKVVTDLILTIKLKNNQSIFQLGNKNSLIRGFTTIPASKAPTAQLPGLFV